MSDVIEKIGKGSVIHHGKLNDRLYLMKLHTQDSYTIVDKLDKLAKKHAYSKLFCKVPGEILPLFMNSGFYIEAAIPGFYNGRGDVFFMAKYLDDKRKNNYEKEQLALLSELLQGETPAKQPEGFTVRRLNENDADNITEIYKQVFESYPFPIHDSAYIKQTMNDNVRYYGAEHKGKLAALSSSEMDINSANTEMTDFATHKDFTGNGLASLLLDEMEKDMKQEGFKTLYTIARLNSIGMNKTFIRAAYKYSGTLINNTNIAGKIESMNVFYKSI